jgi:hypothetical protein
MAKHTQNFANVAQLTQWLERTKPPATKGYSEGVMPKIRDALRAVEPKLLAWKNYAIVLTYRDDDPTGSMADKIEFLLGPNKVHHVFFDMFDASHQIKFEERHVTFNDRLPPPPVPPRR